MAVCCSRLLCGAVRVFGCGADPSTADRLRRGPTARLRPHGRGDKLARRTCCLTAQSSDFTDWCSERIGVPAMWTPRSSVTTTGFQLILNGTDFDASETGRRPPRCNLNRLVQVTCLN